MSGGCKVGDLAVVVRASATPEMLDRLVCVVRLAASGTFKKHDPSLHGPTWIIRSVVSGDLLPTAYGPGATKRRHCLERPFADECLRPIRDPGDDAVDETLLWTTPGDRASRNIERCEKLVAEIEGQS